MKQNDDVCGEARRRRGKKKAFFIAVFFFLFPLRVVGTTTSSHKEILFLLIRTMFARSALRTSRRLATRALSTQAGAAGGGGGGAGTLLAVGALVGAGYVYYDTTEKINDLQVQLSGKTNSAFVFIKPHACKGTPGKVESIVEGKFKEAGIRVTGKGEMTAEQIDKNMYIDTHYGAIASKAVKLKPSELNVPDKGKKDFEKAFGEKWEDAVAAGKVFNAKEGAEKLGLDSAGLNAKWSKLTRGKDLLKFGGGFYCGKVGDIYGKLLLFSSRCSSS